LSVILIFTEACLKPRLVLILQSIFHLSEYPCKLSYLLRDENYECQAYLSVSVLDGDPRHANLLRYALRYTSSEHFWN
jgi:hypothetical protein